MKWMKASAMSRMAIFGVLSVYALVIVLVLIFAGLIMRDVADKGRATNIVFWIFVVGLPLFLAVLVVMNVRNLMIARKHKVPGIRFRIRLVVFFAVVASFSSVPQMVLSLTFVNASLNNTFSKVQEDGMRAGQLVASALMREEVEMLKNSVAALNPVNDRFEQFWSSLKKTYPNIGSLQVIDVTGETRFFGGSQTNKLELGQEDLIGTSEPVRDVIGTQTLLRLGKNIAIQGQEYVYIFTAALPEGYNSNIQAMSTALSHLSYFDSNSSWIYWLLYLFYGFFSLPLVLLSILASFMLSHEILRPLEDLEEGIVHIMSGDYSYRIHLKRDEGLGFLATSFNRMTSELDFSRRIMAQTEKVSAWQEIAQQLAHEIKNPLTPIKLSAERILIKYNSKAEGWEQSIAPGIATIIREVENLSHLLTNFRDFAQMPKPVMKQVKIADIIKESAAVLSSGYPEVIFDFELLVMQTEVQADAVLIKQVFTNLFLNSIESMGSKGKITVRTDLVKKGNTDYCRCQISDTGSGISPENADKVFSPYFTTKKKGTGLGLSFVDRIVVEHRGQIWFESEKEQGTTFYIDLPLGEKDE